MQVKDSLTGSSSSTSSASHYYASDRQQQSSGDDEVDNRLGDGDAAGSLGIPPPSNGGGEDGEGASGGGGGSSALRKHADWRTQETTDGSHHPSHYRRRRPASATSPYSANPNDEDSVPTVFVRGQGPGRRAGHTATAVNRHVYVFGGSCGSDYLNDFFMLDTDPIPPVAISEPTSLQLLERRLRHFYNDEEFSDVTFLVEGRRVFGHKLVLSLVSDCFRAMFTTYGAGPGAGFRESSSDCAEIEIPNCSYDAFVAMLEYVYTGRPPKFEVFHGPPPSPPDGSEMVVGGGGPDNRARAIERVVDLLELADQFFLEHLKQICERALWPAVSAETVEYFLQVAQKTNASQLEAVCRHFERNREIDLSI